MSLIVNALNQTSRIFGEKLAVEPNSRNARSTILAKLARETPGKGEEKHITLMRFNIALNSA